MKKCLIVIAAVALISGSCRSGAGKHPKVPAEIVASENTEADLGTVYESDGLARTVLVVRNEFSDTLVPVAAYTACRCTEASVDALPVAPGDDLRISVVYNPAYRSGIFMEEVRVRFLNSRKVMSLVVKGEVIPCVHPVSEDHPYDYGGGLHLSHEVLHYGKLHAGESRDIFVRYASDSRKGMALDFVPDTGLDGYVAAREGIALPPEGRDTLHFRFRMPGGMHDGDTLMLPIHVAVNGKVLDKALMVKAIAVQ